MARRWQKSEYERIVDLEIEILHLRRFLRLY